MYLFFVHLPLEKGVADNTVYPFFSGIILYPSQFPLVTTLNLTSRILNQYISSER